MSQTSKCKTALRVKEGLSEEFKKGFNLPYNALKNREFLPTKWNEDVFYSIAKDCAITDCFRYLPGCNTRMTSLGNYLKFLPLPPDDPKYNANDIYLNVNINARYGWKQNYCLGCTNGEQTIFLDNFLAEQGNACANAYSVIKDPIPASSLTFDYNPESGSTRKIGNGFTSFFTLGLAFKDKCTIQNLNGCVLFEKDCKTAYKGDDVTMAQESPF